jgi:hypothetical protein
MMCIPLHIVAETMENEKRGRPAKGASAHFSCFSNANSVDRHAVGFLHGTSTGPVAK